MVAKAKPKSAANKKTVKKTASAKTSGNKIKQTLKNKSVKSLKKVKKVDSIVKSAAKKNTPTKKPHSPSTKILKNKAVNQTPTKNKKTVSKPVSKKPTPVLKTLPQKKSTLQQSAGKNKKSNENVLSASKAYTSIVKEDLKTNKAKTTETKVLAITHTIPKSKKDEISLTKIASIAHSLTNAPKSIPGYAVKTEKEPEGKFEMEFVIRASADLIYEFFSTPSGLSEWFCDDLNIRNGVFTFIWDEQIQQARLLKTIDGQLARFQWVEKNDGSYFEFRIQKDDLTNDVSLIITDFAESAQDLISSKKLWQSQIEKLMQVLGSVY